MRVKELWRYPVKSMLGEELNRAEVGELGIGGDRRLAVLDAASAVSLSAKRYGELLSCSARTSAGRVIVGFPDGTEVPADSPETAARLSDMLDRRVVVGSRHDVDRVRHEFAVDSATGEGGTRVVEAPLQAFFDGAPVHLISTSTLTELARLATGSRFERARFRPNILVQLDEVGFVEHGWVKQELQIGEVRFDVFDHKTRCVMTTRPQGDLPRDPDVFKAVVQNNQRRAGVSLRALGHGFIRAGDNITLA